MINANREFRIVEEGKNTATRRLMEAGAAAAEIEASRRVAIRQGNGNRDDDSVLRQKTYFYSWLWFF